MKRIYFIAILFSFSLVSSAQIVDKLKGAFIPKESFTENSLEELETFEVDLSQITFYTSSEIHIQRSIPRDSKVIESTEGHITFDNNKVLSKMKITKGATGVITEVYQDSIKVKFENLEGYELTFIKDQRRNDNQICYYLKVSENRTVHYGPYEWYLNWGNSTQLLWKSKELTKTIYSRKRIRGVKPDGSSKKTFKEHIVGESSMTK